MWVRGAQTDSGWAECGQNLLSTVYRLKGGGKPAHKMNSLIKLNNVVYFTSSLTESYTFAGFWCIDIPLNPRLKVLVWKHLKKQIFCSVYMYLASPQIASVDVSLVLGSEISLKPQRKAGYLPRQVQHGKSGKIKYAILWQCCVHFDVCMLYF